MSELPRKHEKLSYFYSCLKGYVNMRGAVQTVRNVQLLIQLCPCKSELENLFAVRGLHISMIPKFWTTAVSYVYVYM